MRAIATIKYINLLIRLYCHHKSLLIVGEKMIKTITFTCMHFMIAFTVTYLLTGSMTVGGLVAVIEPLCNAVGFYFHEKVWCRFNKAREKKLKEVNYERISI